MEISADSLAGVVLIAVGAVTLVYPERNWRDVLFVMLKLLSLAILLYGVKLLPVDPERKLDVLFVVQLVSLPIAWWLFRVRLGRPVASRQSSAGTSTKSQSLQR
jgi:hypothetical protein